MIEALWILSDLAIALIIVWILSVIVWVRNDIIAREEHKDWLARYNKHMEGEADQ